MKIAESKILNGKGFSPERPSPRWLVEMDGCLWPCLSIMGFCIKLMHSNGISQIHSRLLFAKGTVVRTLEAWTHTATAR